MVNMQKRETTQTKYNQFENIVDELTHEEQVDEDVASSEKVADVDDLGQSGEIVVVK